MAKRPKNKASAKRHLFELFDKGLRPRDIGRFPGIKQRTLYSYYQSWKHGTGNTGAPAREFFTLLRDTVSMAYAKDEKGIPVYSAAGPKQPDKKANGSTQGFGKAALIVAGTVLVAHKLNPDDK